MTNPMKFPGTRVFKSADPESIYNPRTKKLTTEAKSVGGAIYAGVVTGLDVLKRKTRKKK